MFLPEHGGALKQAAQYFNIALADWLDLSTGINPHAWPVPTIPCRIWQRLPEDDAALREAARNYYGVQHCVALPGSQYGIQQLPEFICQQIERNRQSIQVLTVRPSYFEHEKNWRRVGCQVKSVSREAIEENIDQCQVLVLVNPNNPSGDVFSIETLCRWHAELRKRQGFLIIDEAFMDCQPENSLALMANQPGLVILRSFGKFFGLAGLRLGFLLAEQGFCREWQKILGPWAVSYPTQYVAIEALKDAYWQKIMRKNIHASWARLGIMLKQKGLSPHGGQSTLFQWVRTEQAEQIYSQMARQGVLLRLFKDPLSLRIGLPEKEQDWQRLEESLSKLSINKCVA